MNQEKAFENLQYALDNYKALKFKVSPFSLGHETKHLFKNLEGKTLTFQKNKGGLTFFINKKEIINLPFKKYNHGFRLEYQDEKECRIYHNYNNPNDPEMPLPAQSAFRTILDDLLLEIYFKGKILLEEDEFPKNQSFQYWKLKKI
jgi:hypothetical protein